MARSTSVFILLITVALVLSIRSTLATEGPAPSAMSPTAQSESPTASNVAKGFSGTWETWYKNLMGYLGFDASKPNNYSKKKAPAPGHAPAGAPSTSA